MAHTHTRFRLSAKRTSPFKSAGASVQSTTGSPGVRISGSNAGYTMFRGSVKGTGYPLHSPVSTSLPLPCVTVCHHVSTGLYRVSPEGKVAGAWRWPPTPSSAEVKERVGLYLYSPFGPSWSVLGWPLPFHWNFYISFSGRPGKRVENPSFWGTVSVCSENQCSFLV